MSRQLESEKESGKGSNVQLQREGKAMMMMTTIQTTDRESARKMTTQTTAPARNSSRRLTSKGISKGKKVGSGKTRLSCT